MYRSLTALFVYCGVCLIGLVAAEQPKAERPIVFVAPLIPYLGDDQLHKELKLSAKQAAEVVAARQKLWDAAYEVAPKDFNFEKASATLTAELKATLTAEQFKRLNELAAQTAWRFGEFRLGSSWPHLDTRRVSLYTLNRYPALAEAIKLSEAQNKSKDSSMIGLRSTSLYLTPEQSQIAKDLLGANCSTVFTSQYDKRPGAAAVGSSFQFDSGLQPFEPTLLQYVTAQDIHKELKLNAAQIKALSELANDKNRGVSPDEYQSTKAADRAKKAEARTAELDRTLIKIISTEQLKRLKQIAFQQDLGPNGEFYSETDLAKELGLTAEQFKKFDDLSAKFSTKMADLVLSEQSVDKIETVIKSAQAEFKQEYESLLTDEQRAKKQVLVGEPFLGQAFGGPIGGGLNFSAQQKLLFGRYGTQIVTLERFKGLQDELNLTADQLKKLTAALLEYRQKFVPFPSRDLLSDTEMADKRFAERSEYVEKVLNDILTQEQFARFRELQMQQLEALPSAVPGFGRPVSMIVRTAASYPGVAEAINLTSEQKKKLLDGDQPSDVLTDSQKQQIKKLLGKPADLGTVFASPSPPSALAQRWAVSPEIQTLTVTAVWDELKLNDQQVSRLVPVMNEYVLATASRPPTGGFGGRGGAALPNQPNSNDIQISATKLEKYVAETLNADQKKRLAQLTVQRQMAISPDRFLMGALGSAETLQALALTNAQKQTIQKLSAEANRRAQLTFRQTIEMRKNLNGWLEDRIQKELTDAQRAKLKELSGEPFPHFQQPLIRLGLGFP